MNAGAQNRELKEDLYYEEQENRKLRATIAALRAENERLKGERPQWHASPPTKSGWYFMADRAEDYDLARPVPIWRIEDYQGVRYEIMSHDERRQKNVNKFPSAVWFGPFDIVGKPLPKENERDA